MNRFNDYKSQALFECNLAKLKEKELTPESIAYCIIYAIDKKVESITNELDRTLPY